MAFIRYLFSMPLSQSTTGQQMPANAYVAEDA
jgi:hypothetical protein